jgi:hypothetical protein
MDVVDPPRLPHVAILRGHMDTCTEKTAIRRTHRDTWHARQPWQDAASPKFYEAAGRACCRPRYSVQDTTSRCWWRRFGVAAPGDFDIRIVSRRAGASWAKLGSGVLVGATLGGGLRTMMKKGENTEENKNKTEEKK